MVFKLWSYEFESRGSLTMRKIQRLFLVLLFFILPSRKSCQEIFAKGGPNSGKPVSNNPNPKSCMDQVDTDLYKTILPWICFKFALRQILKKTIHLHLRRIQLQIWNLHQIHDKLALHANLQIRIIFAVAANIPVIAAFAPSHPLQIRCEFINLQGCKYGKDDRIWNLHHICRYICTNANVYFHPVNV